MKKIFYKLVEGVEIEKYTEGALFTIEGTDKIICLGNFEYDLLEVIIKNEFSEAQNILLSLYQGNEIEKDLQEFCDKLLKNGILYETVL